MIFQNNFSKNNILSKILCFSFFLVCLLGAKSGFAGDTTPKLYSNTDIASAGFYRLHWETSISQVELQEAEDSAFNSSSILYKGSDSATVISGRPDGTWYYRVRTVNNQLPGDWSEPVKVTVKHHSLSRALLFFFIGLIMFIVTVMLVIKGIKEPG